MEIITIHKAKSNLSFLIKRALKGEKIIIASRGKPFVSLQKIEDKSGGQFKDKENALFLSPALCLL